MNLDTLQDQVETIRVAFSYIHRFKGKTFVIHLDDELLDSPLFSFLIKDIVLLHKMGIKIILIPGARKRIDQVLGDMGISCESVNNIRISSDKAMPFIKMAAFDVSNRIMTFLAENNTDAVIGNWVKARGLGVVDGVNYQSTGKVEKIKTGVIRQLMEDGVIPIFPNIGWSSTGKPYNISTNELASIISKEVGAHKLFFITAHKGIVVNGLKAPGNIYVGQDNRIGQLSVAQAEEFIGINEKQKHSTEVELITLARKACLNGVSRVHIIDGRVEGVLLKEIFSNTGLGTMIYSNPYENIRGAYPSDSAEILRIMGPSVEAGILISRSPEDIKKKIDDYIVYVVDDTVHGCGALHSFPGSKGEIAGISVDSHYANKGIGKKMIAFLVEKAAERGLREVFVLTTQTGDWFLAHGFREASVDWLPKEKKYNQSRNSYIFSYEISSERNKQFFDV